MIIELHQKSQEFEYKIVCIKVTVDDEGEVIEETNEMEFTSMRGQREVVKIIERVLDRNGVPRWKRALNTARKKYRNSSKDCKDKIKEIKSKIVTALLQQFTQCISSNLRRRRRRGNQ